MNQVSPTLCLFIKITIHSYRFLNVSKSTFKLHEKVYIKLIRANDYNI